MKALVLASVIAALVACAPLENSQEDTAATAPPQDESTLYVGMTFDEVEQRWGDTDCLYEVVANGETFDALGYARDARTDEVVGLETCHNATVSLFFRDAQLVAWGEAE